MIETLILKNWRTLLLVCGLIFALFVWPTPYKPSVYYKFGDSSNWHVEIFRESRITGKIEAWWWKGNRWVPWPEIK
jgi:hypothetical protein